MAPALILPCPVGEVSDGYHTFNELYEHRCLLFLALMRAHPEISWHSRHHADGSVIPGYLVAGMDLPTGPVTYHMQERYAPLACGQARERAPEWDGHTSQDVVQRLTAWLQQPTRS